MTESVIPSASSSWLVLGDSLSDGLWSRDPSGIGSAWPGAGVRLAQEAGNAISLINRATGGARSLEILQVLRGDPELARGRIVAVLAGANDLWRRWVPWQDHEPIDPDDYARNLRRIAALAREHGAVGLAYLTPCLLHADPDHPWNQELLEYRQAVVRVAGQEDALLVPTGEEFEAAVRAHPEIKWTYDGVHPRPVGHERLALTWGHHALGLAGVPPEVVPSKPTNHRLGPWP
jgi:acyl-CoA thioesterase-1